MCHFGVSRIVRRVNFIAIKFAAWPYKWADTSHHLSVSLCIKTRRTRLVHQTCHDVKDRERGTCFDKRAPRVRYVTCRHLRGSCFAQA